MVTINNHLFTQLETITNKIENNTAKLTDYRQYEQMLSNAGLPKEYIFSYVKKAGFNSWEEFLGARQRQERIHDENKKSMAVGGLIGIGIGLLLASALTRN